MLQWIDELRQATGETKSFILTWIVHGAIIIGTAVYVYARLDFVRSYDHKATEQHQTNEIKR